MLSFLLFHTCNICVVLLAAQRLLKGFHYCVKEFFLLLLTFYRQVQYIQEYLFSQHSTTKDITLQQVIQTDGICITSSVPPVYIQGNKNNPILFLFY